MKILTNKELFTEIEDATLRNKNQSTFLFNMLEDVVKKEEGRDAVLTVKTANTPEQRELLIKYVSLLPVEDRQPVMRQCLAALGTKHVG